MSVFWTFLWVCVCVRVYMYTCIWYKKFSKHDTHVACLLIKIRHLIKKKKKYSICQTLKNFYSMICLYVVIKRQLNRKVWFFFMSMPKIVIFFINVVKIMKKIHLEEKLSALMPIHQSMSLCMKFSFIILLSVFHL